MWCEGSLESRACTAATQSQALGKLRLPAIPRRPGVRRKRLRYSSPRGMEGEASLQCTSASDSPLRSSRLLAGTKKQAEADVPPEPRARSLSSRPPSQSRSRRPDRRICGEWGISSCAPTLWKELQAALLRDVRVWILCQFPMGTLETGESAAGELTHEVEAQAPYRMGYLRSYREEFAAAVFCNDLECDPTLTPSTCRRC